MIQVTSVTPEYTRRGLANKMTAQVLETAKEIGYTIVVSLSTSAYTQRNKINTFHFEKLLEVSIADNYANYSQMSEELKKSHRTGTVLVKKL